MRDLHVPSGHTASESRRDLHRAAAIILLFAVAGIAAGMAIEENLIKDWQVAVLAPIGCIIAVVWALLLSRGRAATAPEHDRTIDAGQTRGRMVVAVFAVLTLVTAGLLVATPAAASGHEAVKQAFMTGAFAVCAVLAVVFTGLGSRDDDEFVRHLRARAARLGLVIAVPAMLAAVAAVRYRPEWSANVLPLLVAFAATVPALYYIVADWRAGREE
jgi:hypothetical protein